MFLSKGICRDLQIMFWEMSTVKILHPVHLKGYSDTHLRFHPKIIWRLVFIFFKDWKPWEPIRRIVLYAAF